MREVIRTLTLFGRTYALVRGCVYRDGSYCNGCAFLRNDGGRPVCVGGPDAEQPACDGGVFIELPGERGSD
jgi:hypothetical protein